MSSYRASVIRKIRWHNAIGHVVYDLGALSIKCAIHSMTRGFTGFEIIIPSLTFSVSESEKYSLNGATRLVLMN